MKVHTDTLEEIERGIEFQQKRLKTWLEIAAAIPEVLTALEEAGAEVTFFAAIRVSATGGKDLLTSIFRILRTNGFATTNARPKANSPSWEGTFRRKDFQHSLWINFTSNVCKMVKTGTKSVEVPTYEIECSDGSVHPAPDDDIPF